jgi:hypothetical protein
MDLEPDSLFVAVADGALAGYLAGCLDSSKFPSEGERIERAIRKYRLVIRPKKTAGFFARSMLDVPWAAVRQSPPQVISTIPRWPAHLHINMAPQALGTGTADGLILQ